MCIITLTGSLPEFLKIYLLDHFGIVMNKIIRELKDFVWNEERRIESYLNIYESYFSRKELLTLYDSHFNDPNRLELRRYDPTLRRHVTYRESK